jgi:hypothetical protein
VGRSGTGVTLGETDADRVGGGTVGAAVCGCGGGVTVATAAGATSVGCGALAVSVAITRIVMAVSIACASGVGKVTLVGRAASVGGAVVGSGEPPQAVRITIATSSKLQRIKFISPILQRMKNVLHYPYRY